MAEQLLIDGKWIEGTTGDRIPVVNPSTGEQLATVADGSPIEVYQAVQAASVAQKQWAATSPRERAEILRNCWQTLLNHRDELAKLITLENGKPLADATGEVTYAAEFFRWNSEEAVRLHGTIGSAPSGANQILVRHPPIGVVVMITPWNFPAAMITRKVAPALAAGNATVIKPSELTPLTALRVAELCESAGVPPGVINVVPTSAPADWFDAAVEHPATRMVSFTGSTNVGKILLRRSADRVLKVSMELGGNAPFIVFDDADIDQATAGAMTAKMRHSAETCTAANRFFVEQSAVQEFTEKLTTAMNAVTVGDGLNPDTTCGPLINQQAVDSIDQIVQSSIADGATLTAGGSSIEGTGHFYKPTVLTNVEPSAAITQHEIFGPVATIIPFTNTGDMLRHANNTELGLAGYVFTSDVGRGMNVSEQLEVGMVGLNRGSISDPAAPFGGMKQSGLGREGASDGIYEFCETQYIAVSW